MSIKEFANVYFDTDTKIFTILEGSVGQYSYTDIVKCSVVFEDGKYSGKSELFSHQVLVTKVFFGGIFPYVCTGVKYVLKDGSVLYSYISKKKLSQYTYELDKEKEEAQKIKDFVQKIIRKYNTKE